MGHSPRKNLAALKLQIDFRRIHNSMANLRANISDVDNRASVLATRERVSYIAQKDVNFGPQKALNWTVILPILCKFCVLRNLTASITAYISGTKHDIDNQASTLKSTSGLLQATSPQSVMDFGPQTSSNWTCILPTLREFCIPLHFQALKT